MGLLVAFLIQKDREFIMKDFAIDFVSEKKYETLLVEVSYKKQRLFQLNKEKGGDCIEIFIIDDLLKLPCDVEMRFKLDDFKDILEKARRVLLEEC